MTTTTTRVEQPVLFAGLTPTDLTMLLVVLIWGANFSIVKAALTEIPRWCLPRYALQVRVCF